MRNRAISSLVLFSCTRYYCLTNTCKVSYGEKYTTRVFTVVETFECLSIFLTKTTKLNDTPGVTTYRYVGLPVRFEARVNIGKHCGHRNSSSSTIATFLCILRTIRDTPSMNPKNPNEHNLLVKYEKNVKIESSIRTVFSLLQLRRIIETLPSRIPRSETFPMDFDPEVLSEGLAIVEIPS